MTENQQPVFRDVEIVCSDCCKTFVLAAGEQFFYWRREWDNPRRCPDCRKLRRALIRKGDER